MADTGLNTTQSLPDSPASPPTLTTFLRSPTSGGEAFTPSSSKSPPPPSGSDTDRNIFSPTNSSSNSSPSSDDEEEAEAVELTDADLISTQNHPPVFSHFAPYDRPSLKHHITTKKGVRTQISYDQSMSLMTQQMARQLTAAKAEASTATAMLEAVTQTLAHERAWHARRERVEHERGRKGSPLPRVQRCECEARREAASARRALVQMTVEKERRIGELMEANAGLKEEAARARWVAEERKSCLARVARRLVSMEARLIGRGRGGRKIGTRKADVGPRNRPKRVKVEVEVSGKTEAMKTR